MKRPPKLVRICVFLLLGAIVNVAVLSGCTLGDTQIRRGTSITSVRADYGLPDLISDISGDTERRYVPANRPEYEWPRDAPRMFFYLDRNLFVEFVEGKAVRAGSMAPETRAEVSSTIERIRRSQD